MNEPRTRRGFLAATSATAVALAGCTGGSAADPDAIDDGRPTIGPEDAPVTITVFEDFACPACRQFKTQVTPAIVQRYVTPGDARYLHADFPIPVDETWSYAIGSAARAVFEAAGNDAFWEFSSSIYDHQGSYTFDAVENVAADVADVGEAARAAAEDDEYRELLEEEREMGERWGVSGTPSVFVEDEQVDLDELESAIESRL